MFLHSTQYMEQFNRLLEGSESLSIAVAFWGEGAQTLISKRWKGKSLRILCNLSSGGTNPQVIQDLVELANSREGMQILTLDNLHGKVAFNESTAIVGSANLSVNGLGFEGRECSGWHEAGLLTREPEQRVDIQEWFETLWKQGEIITSQRLNAAWTNWLKNRASRPVNDGSLSSTPSQTLKNRNIHVAIYRLKASEQAQAAALQVELDARHRNLPEVRNTRLDFFEDWPDDCEEPLPLETPIITLRYGPTKRVSNVGARIRIPQLDGAFARNGNGHKTCLIMTGKLNNVAGYSFSEEDAKVLAKRLKPWVDELYLDATPATARCLPLDQFIEWEEER
ncbi:phospholipase D family protein [Pseudomonas xanthosomatis]|uniref:phospholipase D family protein n=1 Tax=Pseudomonas xanthosomatis TaxID=2842356 RepID=UPI00351575B7